MRRVTYAAAAGPHTLGFASPSPHAGWCSYRRPWPRTRGLFPRGPVSSGVSVPTHLLGPCRSNAVTTASSTGICLLDVHAGERCAVLDTRPDPRAIRCTGSVEHPLSGAPHSIDMLPACKPRAVGRTRRHPRAIVNLRTTSVHTRRCTVRLCRRSSAWSICPRPSAAARTRLWPRTVRDKPRATRASDVQS